MTTRHLQHEQQASGRLKLAQQRLLRDYPFHAHLVSTWSIVPEWSRVDAIGVTVRQLRICLHYHPPFVLQCSVPQLEGVLLHEVHHVLFEHLWMSSTEYPDERALTLACEVTANEFIRADLPGTPITLVDFPELPPGESTQQRYVLLAQATSRSTGKTDLTAPNLAKSVPEIGTEGPVFGPPCPKKGGEPPQTLDDHSLWREAQGQENLSRSVARSAVARALRQLSKEEFRRLEPSIEQHLQGLLQGNQLHATEEKLRAAASEPRLNWQALLRRFVLHPVEPQPGLIYPSRRLPHLIGIVPGVRWRPGRAHVMAVIDTSASMRTEMLEEIGEELASLALLHRVTLVQCDTRIQHVGPFKRPLRCVRGRGGTDLRPPFARDLVARIQPDCIVYFTDGRGPSPAQPPAIPVLWCITPGGQRPAEWGEVIWLRNPGDC